MVISALTDRTVYRKRERHQPDEIPAPPMTPLQKIVAAQNEQVMVEKNKPVECDWGHDSDDDDQITNTGSIASISSVGGSKIRQTLDLRLKAKGKSVKVPLKPSLKTTEDSDSESDSEERYSIVRSLRSRRTSIYETSLPPETIATDDHVEDLLNQAILDETLDEIQQSQRKRPKNLLLGN